MNLGDGLLFQLENGKPRLIFLSHGVERNPVKASFRPKGSGVLSARQPSCVDQAPAEERAQRLLVARSKAAAGGGAGAGAGGGGGGGGATSSSSTVRRSVAGTLKTLQHHKPGAAKTAAKLKSDKPASTGPLRANGKPGQPGGSRKAGPQDAAANREAALKDSVVCLTNEQLQQLLSTVQTSSNGLPPPEEGGGEGGREEAKAGQPEGLTGSQSGVTSAGGSGDRTEVGGERGASPGSSDSREKRPSGCLFSWMDERQPHGRAASHAKRAQWRRELDEQVAQKQQQRPAPERLQPEDDSDSVLSAQSSRGLREPPAVRSSLRLGEVTPLEEALSAARREEQRRRWLEELDRQREESTRRRREEKLQQSQAEDLQLWAVHFDSMQRRPQLAPPPAASAPPPAASAPPQYSGSERGEWEPSSSLSLVWEAESVGGASVGGASLGGASVGGASVDVTGGSTVRNSYLRTMTSLLDPAQVEERERRRLKQQEQQRAIEAQMEERRLQREQEEARRRREEEEEDRRVALEREALQRQFELDAQKERMKTVQTEKDRGDVRLQETEGNDQAEGSKDGSRSGSSYRDTAVQTEGAQTPDASSVQCEPSPPAAPSSAPPPTPPPAAPPHSRSRAARAGKENICVAAGGDPYEAFARTERSRREKRRPEWNTQRPSRQFVPASARYPAALQRNRQESRLRRQAELLALQERTCVSRSEPAPPPPPPAAPPPASRGQSQPGASGSDRGRSPPVPAVRHRGHSQHASSSSSSSPPPPPAAPPVLEFVPYVRTDEVFNMDPLEPADTPPPRTGAPPAPPQSSAPPPAPPAQRDPLLHAELLRQTHTHRQQEILRGLAQLRQGLLQKQKELETDLNMRRHDNEHWSPPATQHM